MQQRYFAFYTWAYGNEPRREVFVHEDEMLELVKKANAPESGYRNLVVVFGAELQFEPFEKVTAWRIKEDE